MAVPLRSAPRVALAAGNRILAGLPPAEMELLRPHLRPVELVQHRILFEPGDTTPDLILVDSGIVSLIVVMPKSATETAIVGREGIAGVSHIFDVTRAPHRALVQVEGDARALDSGVYRRLRAKCPTLEQSLRRFAFALYGFTAQIAACNRRHTADRRLARWLLLTQDRVDSNVLPLTHEFVAYMLGVRRSTVTVTAEELRDAGLIRYRRGSIEIIDQGGLEAKSCECYEAITAMYAVSASSAN